MKIANKLKELNILPYQYFLAKDNKGKLINNTIFIISNTFEISSYRGFTIVNKQNMDKLDWLLYRPERLSGNLFVIKDGKNKGFYKKIDNKLYRYEGFKKVSDKLYNNLEMEYIKLEQLTKANEQDWINIYSEINMMKTLQKAYFPEQQKVETKVKKK